MLLKSCVLGVAVGKERSEIWTNIIVFWRIITYKSVIIICFGYCKQEIISF